MLRRTMMISGTAMLVLVGSVAMAQQQKQGRGSQQGQGRGPGGFGGGFSGGGSAGLLATPDVQKELGVSDEQKRLIDDMQSDLREQMRSSFSGFRDFQNLSEEERKKRTDEARKKGEEVNKKTEEMIEMILDAKQAERLGELRLQREGTSALSRAEVAKKLGLTEEQQTKIKEIRDAGRQGGGGPQTFRDMSDEERRQLFAQADERRKKREADTLAVLTPEQKETLEKMKGKEFKFAERGRGPGGTGGPTNGQRGSGGSGGGERRRPERKKEGA